MKEAKDNPGTRSSRDIVSEYNWIDIKKDTDAFKNKQIEQLIYKDLFDDPRELTSFEDLNEGFESLSMSSQISNSENQSDYALFEDPFDTLMNRSKNSHLTYKQKSWIYLQYSVGGKSINQLS